MERYPFLNVKWLTAKGEDQIPVVFLHGFLGTKQTWSAVAEEMGRPAMAVDLPGHGSTPSIEGKGPWFEETIERFIAVLDQRGVSAVDLVGYSLGGRLAALVARKYPSRVRRLVLESRHLGLMNPQDRQDRLQSDQVWSQRFASDWPHVLQAWYEQPIFQSNRAFRESLIQEIASQNPNCLSKALMGFSLGHQEPIERLDHPVLYVTGSLDHKYEQLGRLYAQHHRTAQGLQSVFIHESIEGAGHNVHLEQPGTYLSRVRNFLNQDHI